MKNLTKTLRNTLSCCNGKAGAVCVSSMSPVYTFHPQLSTAARPEEAAFRNLREAMAELKQAADGLTEEFAQLQEVARANGGKIPDINEILRDVLDHESNEEESK